MEQKKKKSLFATANSEGQLPPAFMQFLAENVKNATFHLNHELKQKPEADAAGVAVGALGKDKEEFQIQLILVRKKENFFERDTVNIMDYENVKNTYNERETGTTTEDASGDQDKH